MEAYRVVAALSALAQESRLSVFRLLVGQGPEGLPAGRIGTALGLPAPTLSFHLAQLSHAGLVRAQRRGRSILYSADYARMEELLRYLTENCCAGDTAGCDPQALPRKDRHVIRRKTKAR
jgi:DNA-binding transcriptional ArsR family regulator